MSHFKHYQTFEFSEHAWAEFFKLPDDIVSYLWQSIDNAEKNNIDVKNKLAGNISSSLLLHDTDNILLSRVIPYINQNNIIREISKKTEGTITPTLTDFWVNYQYKTEFNPLHWHTGDISFVIWMKIPYEWHDENQLDIVKNTGSLDKVGNFCFVWANGSKIDSHVIFMNKNVESFMCVFPSWLAHMVYPFYTSDNARITISGNIDMKPNQLQDI